MRTDIVLDDELVEEAFRRSDAKTKRELVSRKLRGQVLFHPGYDHKKLREGT